MKVARKHLIQALEQAPKRLDFPKYSIIASYWESYEGTTNFGWRLSVIPKFSSTLKRAKDNTNKLPKR